MDRARLPEHDAPEDVRVECLLSLAFLEGLAPAHGRELEYPLAGPAGQQAEEVSHVAEGLDLVEAAAREQGDEGGVHVGAVVAPDEEPVLAANDFPAQV